MPDERDTKISPKEEDLDSLPPVEEEAGAPGDLQGDEDSDTEGDEETVIMASSTEDELDEIYSRRGQAELEEGAEEENLDDDPAAPEAPAQSRAAGGRQSRSVDPSNVPAFLMEEVVRRASKANERLRAQLTGSIGIKLEDRRQCFLFDWKGTSPLVSEIEVSDLDTVDCSISLKARSLTRIATGSLNPHVAMLSDKISVSGKLGLAIYFFNLVTPAAR